MPSGRPARVPHQGAVIGLCWSDLDDVKLVFGRVDVIMTTAGETLTLIVSLGHSVIILSVLSLLKRDREGKDNRFQRGAHGQTCMRARTL